jgi:nitroreductase
MTEIGLYEAMSSLRAVRKLKSDSIPEASLERVLQAATWAPTGANRQPWRIVLVRSAESKIVLGKLYADEWHKYAGHYAQQFAALPADERAREQRTLDAGNYLAEHFHEAPAIVVFCFNPKLMSVTDAKLDRLSVVGGGSIYPAVQNLLLAARAEGLGCVLTTLLCVVEPQVNELLAIPAGWGTAAVIPLGYPLGGGHGAIRRRPTTELVFDETFGTAHEIT